SSLKPRRHDEHVRPSCRAFRRMAALILLLAACSCKKSPALHENTDTFLHISRDSAKQQLKQLGKDDPERLKWLIALEFDVTRRYERVSPENMAEIKILLEQYPDSLRKGIYHLIRSNDAWGNDYYTVYNEAYKAAKLFEPLKD